MQTPPHPGNQSGPNLPRTATCAPLGTPPRSRSRAGAALLLQTRLACPSLSDNVATEVLLRCQSIVGAAAQREIAERGWASAPVWMLVMELQSGLLAATLAARVDIGAARLVPLPDGAAHFGPNVPTLVRIAFAAFWRGVSRAAGGLRRRRPSRRGLVNDMIALRLWRVIRWL